MNGILNVDKPAGPTSHDVVARVRRLAGTRRVGHAGTLDPAATGVLLILLGMATRLAEYTAELSKRYEAVVHFGQRTDTQDTTGTVLSEEDTSLLTEAAVRAALVRFRGPILQTPPMVSAVKVGGRRLYELARRGETVERAARPVTIHELRLEEFHPGRHPDHPSGGAPVPVGPGEAVVPAWGRLTVVCSSGTYVRTLCAELGEVLGCGAAMGDLRRTAIGPFRADEAVSLETLEQAAAGGRLDELLLPPAAAVAHLPAVVVTGEDRSRLLDGMAVAGCWEETRPDPTSSFQLPTPSAVRVLDEKGQLIAIGRWEGKVIPVKVLAAAAGSPEPSATASLAQGGQMMAEN